MPGWLLSRSKSPAPERAGIGRRHDVRGPLLYFSPFSET